MFIYLFKTYERAFDEYCAQNILLKKLVVEQLKTTPWKLF